MSPDMENIGRHIRNVRMELTWLREAIENADPDDFDTAPAEYYQDDLIAISLEALGAGTDFDSLWDRHEATPLFEQRNPA